MARDKRIKGDQDNNGVVDIIEEQTIETPVIEEPIEVKEEIKTEETKPEVKEDVFSVGDKIKIANCYIRSYNGLDATIKDFNINGYILVSTFLGDLLLLKSNLSKA